MSGAYVAFDILESLKNVRDTRKCLEGLNKLRTALKSEDGVHVLGQLAEATPNFEELVIIWDSQIKASEQHVAITLMLTLTDIFTALSSKSKTPIPAAALTAANAVATALITRRLRSFYSHLASQQRTRATPALLLLAAIASLGPSTARELVRVFDFGLSALPQLARSLRPRKGETSEQAGIRQRQEWASPDPLKRPTRAAFTSLCQALLLTADVQLLPEILRIRPLIGGTLHHLSNDPPLVQLEMLKIVRKKVVASKVPLGPATKAELFSDATLGQLAAICAAGEDDIAIADVENTTAKTRRQASDLSFQILHSVCTDPRNGLCSSIEACLEFRTLQSSAVAALNHGQRRLIRWLQRLKPAESSRQGELLRAAVTHDAALAAAMLLSLHYPMEPTATGRWLVHSSIVGSLMQSVASAQVGLVELGERGLSPPELSVRSMQAVLRCALPLALPRAALSRGVQHNNALVRHAVLCLLAHMLTVLQSLLEAVHQATAALPASASPSVRVQWSKLETALQQTARASLPDLQPILAQLSAALNPQTLQKNSSNTPISNIANADTSKNKKKKDRLSSLEIKMDNIVMPESDDEKEEEEKKEDGEDMLIDAPTATEKAGLNTAIFSATMHVLQRWRRCLPSSFAESNVDVEKLVPEELATLPPLHQLQMLALLQTTEISRKHHHEQGIGGEGGAYLGTGTGPAFFPVLKILAASFEEQGANGEVKAAAARWAVERSLSTGLFEANPAEAFLWIDLIPVSESGVEIGFLHDALALVLRRPGEFYSFLEAENGGMPQGAGPEMSLLVLCVLRQALRVLSSEKKSVEEKMAIASYTAKVAALAVMQEREQNASAAASAALLKILISEAARGDGADNDNATPAIGQKRKAHNGSHEGDITAVHAMLGGLGQPAEPLAALASWLEAVSSSSLSSNLLDDKSNTAGKKKKSKKGTKEQLDEKKMDSAFQALPVSLFPGIDNVAAASDLNNANIENVLGSVQLCQLSMAIVYLGQTESSWSNERIFDHVSSLLESTAGSQQRALLVIRQALHLLSTYSPIWEGNFNAASMLCAVLRGALAATLKQPSSSLKQAASCISLLCSSETLLTVIYSSSKPNVTEEAVLQLWQWLFEKVVALTATAPEQGVLNTKNISSSLVLSLRPVVARIFNKASESILTKNGLLPPPTPAVLKLLPLAIAAAARGPPETESKAISVTCSLLDSISGHTKDVDIQWIDIAGECIISFVSASDKEIEPVLKVGCDTVADLLDRERSSEACVLLEKLVVYQGHLTKILHWIENDVISALLHVCVTAPTLQKSSLACVLLKTSGVARLAFLDALHALHQSVDGDDRKTKKKSKEKRRKEITVDATTNGSTSVDKSLSSRSLIALLPPLTTFFELLKKVNTSAATAGVEVSGLKYTATSILQHLLALITNEGEVEVEEDLIKVLHTWGLPCLSLVLSIAKPSKQFISEAIHALLPKDNNASSAPTAAWPLTGQGVEKAAAIDALLHYLLSFSTVSAATLAPIARTFFLTISATFKTKAATQKNVDIARKYLQLLDASVSDAVAALSDSERNSPEFAKIAGDACNEFGTAVLRNRAEDPVAMRVLRRFAAALLPSSEMSENGNGSEDEDAAFEEFSNSKVAISAAELFQKVVSHSHFLSTMKNAAASPPALPAVAAAVPLPLQSLLPLAEAPAGDDHSKEEEALKETEDKKVNPLSSSFSSAVQQQGEKKDPLAQVKRELCMLLETLLDVEDTFKSFKKSSGAELLAVETVLLPVVMAAYGGSCSAADKAAWDLAKSLNLRAWKRAKREKPSGGVKKMEVDTSSSDSDSSADDEEEEEDMREELCALLEGPLAKTCFAWGPSAVAAAASLPAAAAFNNSGDISAEFSSRLQALQSKLLLDPVRCALTVTHFPEKCSLFGGGEGGSSTEEVKPVVAADAEGITTTEKEAVEHTSSLPNALLNLLPTSPAAYDPSFLLPFCVVALRVRLLPPRLFAQTGLASVCLRATAAEDTGVRAMAFEALGLLTQQLQFKGNQQKKLNMPSVDSTAAGAFAPGEEPASFEMMAPFIGDFKERAQLLSLLEWVRDAIETPFTRLPAVHAVFLAEAALLVSHPSHPMFGPISKARLKTATLDVSLVPLFRQTILSGSQDARIERSWLLQLLRAGLRSSADARVYLRQYIFELVMGLYDAAFIDSTTSSLALGVILAACSVPRAAREMVERGGLVGWLASRAATAVSSAIASTNEKNASNKFEDAVSIMKALQTLTTLRAVVGGGKGSSRAAEDFTQTCRCMLSMLCKLSASESTLTPSQVSGLARVWEAALPVFSWTTEAAAGAGVAFLSASEIQVVNEMAHKIEILNNN